MGIHKVTSIYAFSKGNRGYLSQYSGGKIIIDAYSIIHKNCIGYRKSGNQIMDIDGNPVDEVFVCLNIAICCIKQNITPIFVFDGKTHHDKNSVLRRRRKEKEKAEEKLKSIEINDSLEEYIKMYKKSFSVNRTNINRAIHMLKMMGVPVIQAVGEADSQCAAIARYYYDDKTTVMTDDFDTILYGAPSIIRLHTMNGTQIEEFSANHFLIDVKRFVKTKYNFDFDHRNIIECCCLMGTDYCKGIGLDFQKTIQLYCENDRSIKLALESVQKAYPHTIRRMEYIIDQFINIPVIDPSSISIQLQIPNIPIFKQIIEAFLEKKCADMIVNMIKINHMVYTEMISQKEFANFDTYFFQYATKKYGQNKKRSIIQLIPANTKNTLNKFLL